MQEKLRAASEEYRLGMEAADTAVVAAREQALQRQQELDAREKEVHKVRPGPGGRWHGVALGCGQWWVVVWTVCLEGRGGCRQMAIFNRGL